MRKGTKVIITLDLREKNEPGVLGQEAVFIGYTDKRAWVLFDQNGNAVRESDELPDGHVEWHPGKEKFPQQNCGVKDKNPIFRLNDGTEITGLQCCWLPKNPKIRKRELAEIYEQLDKAKR